MAFHSLLLCSMLKPNGNPNFLWDIAWIIMIVNQLWMMKESVQTHWHDKTKNICIPFEIATNCCHFDDFVSMEIRNCLGCRCASLCIYWVEIKTKKSKRSTYAFFFLHTQTVKVFSFIQIVYFIFYFIYFFRLYVECSLIFVVIFFLHLFEVSQLLKYFFLILFVFFLNHNHIIIWN